LPYALISPLLIHIQLNLSDLLFLQCLNLPVSEVLLDRETTGLMIDRVSLPIFYLEKRKNACFHGENGQFREMSDEVLQPVGQGISI